MANSVDPDETTLYEQFHLDLEFAQVQLTLVISTSLISNNRLSRSENLVPAYTWKPNNRWKIL